MSKLTRENAILPFLSDEDFTGKEGFFVTADGTKIRSLADADELPLGLILIGSMPGDFNSVAIGAGGLAGTVKVKLSGAISVGDNLMLDAPGTVSKYTSAPAMLVATALEEGVAEELIEAVIFRPTYIAS